VKYLYLYDRAFLKAHETLQFVNIELVFQMKNIMTWHYIKIMIKKNYWIENGEKRVCSGS